MSTKLEIEARRGIVRDKEGKIIRSKEWFEQRIELLKAKETDLQNRIKNIKAEIKSRTLELEQ